jgi:hypothetical protein
VGLGVSTASASGSFSAATSSTSGGNFTVQPVAAAGPVVITVKDALGDTANYTLNIYKANIVASSYNAASGHLVSFSGSGWPANDTNVTVRLEIGTTITDVCTLSSNYLGVIEAKSCTVPTGLAGANYLLNAEDGQLSVNAPTTFGVSPVVAVTATSGGAKTADANAGQVMYVSGTSFAAGSAVVANFGPQSGAVASTDNGDSLSSAGVLTLQGSTGGFASAGSGIVVASDGTHAFTWTGTSGNSLTGCTYSGSQSATLSTNDAVYGSLPRVTLSPAPTVSTSGTFPTSGTAPTFTVPNIAPGKALLSVSDSASPPDVATYRMKIFNATLSVSSSSGSAGSQITYAGAGWPSDDTVTVRMVSTSTTTVCNVSSDSTGTIAAQSCTLPTGLAAGNYTVTASDGSIIYTYPIFFDLTPSVALTNSSGTLESSASSGSAVYIEGWGYASGSTVTVQLNGATVATSPSTVPTQSSSGNIGTILSRLYYFVLPAVTNATTYTVTVTDASSNHNTASVPIVDEPAA